MAVLERTDPDARNDLDKFLRQNPVPFTVLLDEHEYFTQKFSVKGEKMDLPAYILVDSNGIVRDISSKLNKKAILELLDEQQIN